MRSSEGKAVERNRAKTNGKADPTGSTDEFDTVRDSDKVAERSWQSVDLAAILSGSYEPPKPVVGQRSDGVGLFYRSKVHTVASASESGKTWLVIAAAFYEIQNERHCLYVDFEDNAEGIAGRLLTFGLAPKSIQEFFHYKRPSQSVNSVINRADLFEDVIKYQPTLAVIDGITEAMTMHGLDPMSNKDIAAFGELLPRALAVNGPATVCLDHVVKDPDTRGRYALGGVHKLNGLDGAAYILEANDPFGIGITGRSTILLAKDRPGQLRKYGLRRKDGLHTFGELVIESQDDTYAEFEIKPPDERIREFRPTIVMQKISEVYEKYDKAMSQREALEIVGGDASTRRLAFSLLRVEGYLSERTPHTLLRRYRSEEDPNVTT